MPRRDSFRFDGFRVPVELWGGGDPTLVFLPGLGVHPRYYRFSLESLSRQCAVVLPDLSFRSHTDLRWGVEEYLDCVEALAEAFAPEAPRAGHSFGGMLALIGARPAIACAPSVPVRLGWTFTVLRAARLQLEEYGGREGWNGVRFAASIMCDYAVTALRRPRMLFPVVSEFHGGITPQLRPAAPRAHVILSQGDRLYRDAEYDGYLTLLAGHCEVTRLDAGHDWPVTRPRLFTSAVIAALQELEGDPSSTAAG